MSNIKWFKNAQLGIMVHFGLYSVLEGEYRGESANEWARQKYKIPMDEYHKLASVFNPVYFDAEEWISYVKSAGAKYFVITSKHHEGFALFDSKVSDFNVVKATPFGRDIIKEIVCIFCFYQCIFKIREVFIFFIFIHLIYYICRIILRIQFSCS